MIMDMHSYFQIELLPKPQDVYVYFMLVHIYCSDGDCRCMSLTQDQSKYTMDGLG